jgi:membrane protein implicated in regulation of membrane protease activity
VINAHAKTLPEAIAELKDELKDFISTRATMLRSELGEKLRMIKLAAPVVLIGVLLLMTAWLLFTGFLVCIIAQAFAPSPWAYTLSFIVVAVLYAIGGGAAAYMGWKQLRSTGLKPERTIRVLEQDRIWLQTEAKSQL